MAKKREETVEEVKEVIVEKEEVKNENLINKSGSPDIKAE